MSVFSRLSGVYAFTCLSTSLKYVGSSSNVRVRLSEHMTDSRPEKVGNNFFISMSIAIKAEKTFLYLLYLQLQII